MRTAKVVSDGTETQDARVLVASDGEIRKAGAGTWQIPLSYLAQPWTAAFAADEGTLQFLNGADAGSYVAPTTLPASITDKALLWVDATDTDHIVQKGGAVSTWYDRREPAMVETPAYCRASAYTSYTTDLPELATVEGVQSVYFGGLTSGRCMEWLLPAGTRFAGTTATTIPRQVFVVHSVSNTYGLIIGGFSGTPLFKRDSTRDKTDDPSKSMGNYYWESGTIWPAQQNGRTYLNGERIDGSITGVKKELHLLEASVGYNATAYAQSFFGGSSKNASGGDYICEALVFTNLLTETERLQVEEYLMAKWLPNRTARTAKVALAADVTLAVDGAYGAGAGERLALSGDGTVVKTGEGTFVYDNRKSTTFDGEIDLQEGGLTLCGSAPVKAKTGRLFTVSDPAGGTTVAVSDAPAGTFAKDGADRLDVNAIPADAQRISVKGGTLAVRSKVELPVPASMSTYEIAVPNGNFEEFAEPIAEKTSAGDGAISLPWSPSWIGRWRLSGAGGGTAMDWERWTGKSSSMGATRSDFNFYSHPPEGKCALVLYPTVANEGAARSESFVLPETGAYEIDFWYSGRETSSYIDMGLVAELVSTATGNASYVFGTNYQTYVSGYLRTKMRIESIPAGEYFMRFRAMKGGDIKIANNNQMGRIIVDDVHLRKVPSDPLASTRWKIPGGDFETPLGHNLSKIYADEDHAHPCWTFVQPPSWTEGSTYAYVGLTTMSTVQDASTYGYGSFYNNSREPNAGSVQLCFLRGDAVAQTTFTPPAGTWQLQGDFARLGSYGCYPKIVVSAEIGGETVELGTVGPVSRLMGPMAAGKSFTVDGNTPVTLKLTSSNYNIVASGSSNYGVLVDDLMLVSATTLELYRDGNCEETSSYRKDLTSKSAGGRSGKGGIVLRNPNEAAYAFGTTTIDGARMATVENLSGIYEDIEFPFAGRYRLSFYAHSRLNDKTATGNYGPNPVRAWIAQGGVTNVIGYADTMSSEWVQRVFDFTVDEPGQYRVCIQGMSDPESDSVRREAHIDAISLKQVIGTADRTPPFPETCKIDVAAGAKLKVDFGGTNHVNSIRLGGHSVRGVIDAADYPEFLEGTGVFETDLAPGLLLLLK